MALNNSTPVKTNKITQATSPAQADYMGQSIFQGGIFFAYGHVRTIGDGRLQELQNVYLDGLGPIWSGTYAIVTVEHRISEDGSYTCELDVAANSIAGTANYQAAAEANQAALEGTATSQDDDQHYFNYGSTGSPTAPGTIQSPEDNLLNPQPVTANPLGLNVGVY